MQIVNSKVDNCPRFENLANGQPFRVVLGDELGAILWLKGTAMKGENTEVDGATDLEDGEFQEFDPDTQVIPVRAKVVAEE